MIIYQSNGAQRTTFDSYDYSGTHMGERKVVVTIQSPTAIDFNIGDYIDLRGEYFYLQTKPVMNRNYQTLMLTYTLTFWWTGYELGLTKFLDVVENEPDRVYYSSNNNVAFAGTIKNLLDRLIANLNRTHPVTAYFNDSWHYFIGDTVDQTVVKDIVADDLYCDAVLQFANSEFGLDFIIQPTRRILVGFTAAELNASAPLFEYGKDKGLCDINRLQNDQKVITRVYAYGAERNISQDYRIGESGHENHTRLILPEIGAIGGTDLVCTGGYLANTALEAIYGIREDSYINDKIYPSVTLLDNTIKKVDAITDRPEVETPILSRTEIVPAWIEWIPNGDMSPASYIIHPEEVRVINAVQPTYDTVTVYVDVPFDINREDIKSPVNAKMAFKTGYMQTKEFEILAWEREKQRIGGVVTETGLWKVTLKRNVDGNNYSLPNTNLPIQVGDEFVLLDIYLPDEYEEAAEQALLEDAITWLQARQTSPDGYSIKVPEEYIARNPADEAALVEGFPVQFKDTVIGATQQAVTIQSLSISCRDGNLPTYDLTISTTPIKGYIGKLNDQLKKASQRIATVNSTTEREISSILKSAQIFQSRVLNNTWNIDGSIIESKSILPSALSTEIRATDYVLHAYFQVNYGGDPNVAYGSSGVMIHKDIDISWGGEFDIAHSTWTIAAPQTFVLDPAKYYYVYIKGSQTDGTASWVLSETRVGVLDIDGYFMFEWGAVLGIRDGIRYSQNQYGVNQVSAYVYIAYGSSLLGDDFTLVPDSNLRFMAIKSSPTEIETPVVTDFVGLWFERKPDPNTVGNDKVKYDANDPTAGYLSEKVVAGANISLTEGDGIDENKLEISVTGFATVATSGSYTDLLNKPTIPTNTNQLTNGAGFITGYTETDPTIYSWAKAATKPSYTYAEVGAQATLVSGTNIKTINGSSLLGAGDLTISGGTTNLGYTASATNGIVTSDTGTDATIPAGSTTNASLMLPADKTKLDGIAASANNYALDVNVNGVSDNLIPFSTLKFTQGTNVSISRNAFADYTISASSTNLSYDAPTRVLSSSTGSAATIPLVDASNAGLMSAAQSSNLATAYAWGNHATAGYQATLISGTNIKTINGTSILGSGNITVTGGSGISLTDLSASSPIQYNNTTGAFSMIANAYAPYGTVSFPGFGTNHTTAAYGDHTHAGAYEVPLTFSTGLNRTGNTVVSTITQYTDALARGSISLTTTGSSGAATYNSSTGVLNIPQYVGGSGMIWPTGSGIPIVSGGNSWGTTITDNSSNWNTAYAWGNHATAGYQATLISGTNIKTINGSSLLGAGDLTITGGAGTVTSVGLSAPTGFSVSGSPVTGSGTLTLSFASGYSLPTTTKQTQWDSAYTNSGKVTLDGGANYYALHSGSFFVDAGSVKINVADSVSIGEFKPITSNAVATVLQFYQPTLVSGTNIKTINGSSILGSGNLTISSSTTWGSITGTLSAQTDLQSALNAKAALNGSSSQDFLTSTLILGSSFSNGWSIQGGAGGSFAVFYNGSVKVSADSSGNVTAQEFYRGSSRLLKHNITDLSVNALELLMNVDIVEYDMISDGSHAYGFIAEDTTQILSGKDQKGHVFGNHLAMLTRAIQQEFVEIEILKQRVNELESKIQELTYGR